MSSKLWLYGDSFTCFNVAEDGEFGNEYKKTLTDKFVHWPHQISNHLNIDTNNIVDNSRSGMSPQDIFNKCLSTSNQMEKGDWVIISDSPPIRQLGYDHRHKDIRTINNEALYSVPTNLPTKEEMETRTKVSSWRQSFNDENEVNSYVDYLYYFLIPNLEHWESFYRKQIIDLLHLLKSKEINCIFWSWQLWSNEVFTPWRDEFKKGDDHWGQKGCNEFAEYLKKRIDNKEMVNKLEWINPKSLVKTLL
jgi:hypothetical protein